MIIRNSNLIILLFLTTLCSCNNNSNRVETVDNIQADSAKVEKHLSDSETKAEKEPWKIKRIDGKQILFQNGDTLKTTLNDLEYLGQFKYKNDPPYLLLSGVDCDTCDAGISLYIHSPKDGELLVKHGESTYSLAGKLFDFMDNSLVYESRVFYGEVLPDTTGTLWIQKDLQSDNSFKETAYLLHINDTIVWLGFLSGNNDNIIKRVEVQQSKGLCEELSGRKSFTTP
jgi:hypothetical protein